MKALYMKPDDAAEIIETEDMEETLGGGVCQISSTFYNAALYAELEIVQRNAHSMSVGYLPLSLDAAIAGDWKDVKIDADVPEDDAPTAAETAAAAAVGAAVAEQDSAGQEASDPEVHTYVLNTNTLRFHWPDCKAVRDMKEKNKQEYTGTREDVIAMGYTSCGICRP